LAAHIRCTIEFLGSGATCSTSYVLGDITGMSNFTSHWVFIGADVLVIHSLNLLSEEKGFIVALHYSHGIIDMVIQPATKIMMSPRVSLT